MVINLKDVSCRSNRLGFCILKDRINLVSAKLNNSEIYFPSTIFVKYFSQTI